MKGFVLIARAVFCHGEGRGLYGANIFAKVMDEDLDQLQILGVISGAKADRSWDL